MEHLPDKGVTWPYCDRTLKHTWIGTLTMLWYWFPCKKQTWRSKINNISQK